MEEATKKASSEASSTAENATEVSCPTHLSDNGKNGGILTDGEIDEMAEGIEETGVPLVQGNAELDCSASISGGFVKVELSDVEKEKRVILVIGKTGNGKTTVSNILLGEKKFKVGRGMSSTTVESQKSTISSVLGRHCSLKVVDTPDISNMEFDEAKKRTEVDCWKTLTDPGPHVILLVVRCDVRYTAEEYSIYKEVKQLWNDDENFCKRLMVAFTFGDRLDRDIEKELEGVCQELQQVLKDARDRYVVFDGKIASVSQAANEVLTKGGDVTPDCAQPAMMGYLFTFITDLISHSLHWVWSIGDLGVWIQKSISVAVASVVPDVGAQKHVGDSKREGTEMPGSSAEGSQLEQVDVGDTVFVNYGAPRGNLVVTSTETNTDESS